MTEIDEGDKEGVTGGGPRACEERGGDRDGDRMGKRVAEMLVSGGQMGAEDMRP